MRILFYFAWSLDHLGGAEVSVMGLAEALRRRGHHIGIIQMAPIEPAGQAQTFSSRMPVWGIPVAYPGRHPRTWRSIVRSVCRFQRILWQFKPDIVSVQCPSWQSIPVVSAWTLPHRWRLVVTAHGSDIQHQPFAEPRVRPWLSRLLERADAVTTVSASLWRDVLRQFPAAGPKGRVINNGLEASWFEGAAPRRDTPKARYVLFVGRLHRVKGVDVLLRAWKRLQAQAPGIALWLAGDGEEQGNLIALSQTLGLDEHLRSLGRVHRCDLPDLYRNAEFVVIPSRDEGLPLVALEAGACGAVCVATRVGGIPEAIDDGVTGFLVEPESPNALADALLAALRLSPEDRLRIGAAARAKVAQFFTQDRTTAGYEELFHSVREAGPALTGAYGNVPRKRPESEVR